ncbi:signal transduction histidine kinase/CheY-like chemotaxis protein [Pedobacter africanus]|uniref:ATP-binding response regulator n=1 Tax=Pedobacter africanus TaxID=151894 RepID=UPI00339364DC
MTFEYLLAVTPHGKYAGELTTPRKLVVRLIKIFCWATALACFILGPYLFFRTGAYLILLPATLEGCLSLSVIYLATKGKYRSAITLMFSLHSLAIWYYAVLLGPPANLLAFSLFLFLAAFFWFDHKKTLFHMALTATAVMLILIELNYSWRIIAPIEFTPAQQDTVSFTANISVAVLFVILVYSYFSARSTYDNSLALKAQKEQDELLTRMTLENKQEKDYLSITTHDMRGAVNLMDIIITSHVDRQEDGVTIPNEYFEVLKTAVKDTTDVVRDVLSTNKEGDTGCLKMEAGIFNLREFIKTRKAYRLLRKKIPEVNIKYDLPSDYIITDPYKLKCIINNLFINAVKYCQNNIDVSLRQVGQFLFLDFTNDIAPYYMGEKQPDSSGLGLPLISEMCQLLSGSVDIKSHPSSGQVHFQVVLPLFLPEAVNSVTPVLKCVLSTGATVYLVDDNLMETTKISRFLTTIKCNVRLFSSVDEVLKATTENPPELIICDLHMPDKGARELLKEMSHKNILCTVPVLVNTGENIRTIRKELTAMGASGFLSKMATLREFIEAINIACKATT